MRAEIRIVPARLVHVGPIASRLREADRQECIALGRLPKEALRIGLRTSLHPLTVVIDGRPEAMLGVMPLSLMRGSGLIWMLGTDALFGCARAFATIGPMICEMFREDFRELGNIVAVDNHRAIRVLRHLGFHVGGTMEWHGGVAFVPFRMKQCTIQAAAAHA